MSRIDEIRERAENGQPSCRSDTMYLLSEIVVRDRAMMLMALTIEERQPLKGWPGLWVEKAMETARAELAKPEGAKEGMMLRIHVQPDGCGEWQGWLVVTVNGETDSTCECSGPSREAVRIAVYQEACRLLGEALLSA